MFWATLVLSVLVSAGLVIWMPGQTNDFIFDWLSVTAVTQGISPYQSISALTAQLTSLPPNELAWIHPRSPGSLALMLPVALLPLHWVYIVGRTLVAASAFWFAWVAARTSGRDPKWFMAAVPILLVVWPFSDNLFLSQSGFVVAGCILATWLLGDRWLAGAPLAVAVSLKFWPWLLVLGLWMGGRRRAALGAIVCGVGLNLAGLLLPGVTIEGFVGAVVGAPVLTSVAVFAGSPIWLLMLGAAVSLLLLGRRWNPYALAIPIGLVFSPVLWPHYLVSLLAFVVIGASQPFNPTRVDLEGETVAGGALFGRFSSVWRSPDESPR